MAAKTSQDLAVISENFDPYRAVKELILRTSAPLRGDGITNLRMWDLGVRYPESRGDEEWGKAYKAHHERVQAVEKILKDFAKIIGADEYSVLCRVDETGHEGRAQVSIDNELLRSLCAHFILTDLKNRKEEWQQAVSKHIADPGNWEGRWESWSARRIWGKRPKPGTTFVLSEGTDYRNALTGREVVALFRQVAREAGDPGGITVESSVPESGPHEGKAVLNIMLRNHGLLERMQAVAAKTATARHER